MITGSGTLALVGVRVVGEASWALMFAVVAARPP